MDVATEPTVVAIEPTVVAIEPTVVAEPTTILTEPTVVAEPTIVTIAPSAMEITVEPTPKHALPTSPAATTEADSEPSAKRARVSNPRDAQSGVAPIKAE